MFVFGESEERSGSKIRLIPCANWPARVLINSKCIEWRFRVISDNSSTASVVNHVNLILVASLLHHTPCHRRFWVTWECSCYHSFAVQLCSSILSPRFLGQQLWKVNGHWHGDFSVFCSKLIKYLTKYLFSNCLIVPRRKYWVISPEKNEL